MVSNIQNFKNIVQSLGDIWKSSDATFTNFKDTYQACYSPDRMKTLSAWNYREYFIEWNDFVNTLKIYEKDFDEKTKMLYYFAEGEEKISFPEIEKVVNDVSAFVENLLEKQNGFELNQNLQHVDKTLLGEIVFNETCSDTSGSFEEIGNDLYSVLCDCKTKEEYDLVNRTVRAISGSSLESLVDMIDMEKYEKENY